MDLEGGVAIVTGAGGGIGSAIAEGLAGRGMALVLADRDRGAVEAVAGRLPGGAAVEVVVGDVAEPEHHESLLRAAESLGGLRLSVLNAGVYLPGLSWEQSAEAWDVHVRVNLWGVVHGVRSAVPVLLESGVGHVVATASGAGLVAPPALAPYVATKHAVVGLMESLHHELARVRPDGSVGASVVCPGDVRTPMASNSLAAAGVESEEIDGVAASVAATVRAGNEAGEDPSTVADALVDAVTSEPRRFWVLPQPLVALGALDRFQRLADGRPPVDLLP